MAGIDNVLPLANYFGLASRRVAWLLGLVLIFSTGMTPVYQVEGADRLTLNDHYSIRVSECDDGGRAVLNNTLIIDVGFNETSDWQDITGDLTKKKNLIKFQVVNTGGAITYRFQVRKNDELIFDQRCGTVAVRGCEENRECRIGVAREFLFIIEK